MQTEGLLVQSQQLATELQTQQSELQQTNETAWPQGQHWPNRTPKSSAKNQK